MNFLSHFHFDRSEDSFYNTGLVLPDLVRNLCGTHLKPEGSFVNPSFVSLQRGCFRHFEADRRFHNSVYFQQINALIASLLNPEGGWPRKWFLNHLLSEILTDRVLMDLHPSLCDEFYSELASGNHEQTALFLKLTGVHNPQNYTGGMARFMESRFISEYSSNEKIILALNRVYRRLGIDYEWTGKDRELLLAQIPPILSAISDQLPLLQDSLK